MLTELKIQPSDFNGTYIDPTGRALPCFNLPRRETLILVSGYSVILRSKIIDRLEELESQAARALAIPTSCVEALRLAADEAEKRNDFSQPINALNPLPFIDSSLSLDSVGRSRR